MERKKRSKGRGWESCYVKKIYGTFGVEMRAYGQKLVKFCTHTHTHARAREDKLVVEMIILSRVYIVQFANTQDPIVNVSQLLALHEFSYQAGRPNSTRPGSSTTRARYIESIHPAQHLHSLVQTRSLLRHRGLKTEDATFMNERNHLPQSVGSSRS